MRANQIRLQLMVRRKQQKAEVVLDRYDDFRGLSLELDRDAASDIKDDSFPLEYSELLASLRTGRDFRKLGTLKNCRRFESR